MTTTTPAAGRPQAPTAGRLRTADLDPAYANNSVFLF